jgi:hypothetical protein
MVVAGLDAGDAVARQISADDLGAVRLVPAVLEVAIGEGQPQATFGKPTGCRPRARQPRRLLEKAEIELLRLGNVLDEIDKTSSRRHGDRSASSQARSTL